MPLLELTDIVRHYGSGAGQVRALDGVSLNIEAGEFVAIMGQSGSGKSTLMHIIGCLDRPDGGRYRIRGQDVAALDSDQLAEVRSGLAEGDKVAIAQTGQARAAPQRSFF